MPSGPSSPRSASIPRSESSPSGTQAPTATNPTESHGHVSNNGQQDPASPTKQLSWNHLRQGESHQRIRHGAKQLLRLTESFSAFDGAGPAGGHDTAHEHAFPTDDDLRTMSRLSHSIARDINEIRALRKDDPNAQNQKRKTDESSQQQAAFRNDASDRGDPPARRLGRRAEFSCHKCHRVETPEWRPGPDGPGTLCNVCGLIYAKRERKKDELTMPASGSPSFS